VVEVAFVTTNPGKFREAREILRPYGVRLTWVRRPLTEPQSDDLVEVARSKSLAVRGLRGYVLVEDSGLFVRSLQGFPGVYSAHFLKIWGFPPLFELLRRRPRAAVFRSVAVLRQGRTCRTFVGEVQGKVARRASGDHGFGYDPVFVPRGYRSTFGQLPTIVKNAISHRARAMAQVGEFLSKRRRGTTPRRGRRPGEQPRRGLRPRPVISRPA
jgi:XTP/dITP diphosphohydrolase